MGSTVSKSGNNSSKNLDAVEGDGKKGKHGKGSDDSYYATSKAHPVSSEVRRIQIDIEQAQALIRKLDSKKGIENNVLSSSDHEKSYMNKSHGSVGPIVIIQGSSTVKGLEGAELLDTLVTYLWRIHGVDYYAQMVLNGRINLIHSSKTEFKAPGGTPIMQQPAPRGNGRQRPPIGSRLRDERGNHRFDRNVDSPTRDGSGENPDDPIYDLFGDPAMHGGFPPDIPAPPVLMPVPGVG
ncbi:Serrate RNA effector molecule [Zea mays]|uniref:Serrate RNA effector molecule n=1 Tax=Zea mays TaxID=4577 RepID=A0A1D6EZN3_MAIZE|nr:Serrate RNA effector molecule [Zea mays]